jgi:hypothetical protein
MSTTVDKVSAMVPQWSVELYTKWLCRLKMSRPK